MLRYTYIVSFFLILIILLSKSYKTQLHSVAARISCVMCLLVRGKYEMILILAVIKSEMTSFEYFFLPCYLHMCSPPYKEPIVGLQINIWICQFFFIYQLMHKRIALKEILKFTLKQLQHVSV